ncbi:hypothetical protein CEUSTIGMA_g9132.t1 [Chlamydomonas eustigma]|uniref:DNA topoisomerase 2 n=1 Tax=Chlamydomonas eustigma TaxID=1157962 RepID=A0A250XF39_9CHLO|nr:hypothetical protein CEUSTIGMA_g9132.t1 [Chlamydomonas eustigma]|eukprot:GAX81704.1 hypothetical protein CEUSTIGMA_g9132.t1 [Chlamydomonas eustigma]
MRLPCPSSLAVDGISTLSSARPRRPCGNGYCNTYVNHLLTFGQSLRIYNSHEVRGSSTATAAVAPAHYDAEHIQVLDGLEPVRKRPGMYIGNTGVRGLHHLLYEVLDNAIDEVQAGFASHVDIDVDVSKGWVTIKDDGRGIPTGIHPRTGKSALETVLTVLHAGGKFGGESSGYQVSGGLHGVGISVVNALSRHLEVKVWRGGVLYQQEFTRGAALGPMTQSKLTAEERDISGTQIRFLYDDTILAKNIAFDPDTIRTRLRELAFLNSAAWIRFRARKGGKILAPTAPTSLAVDSRSQDSSNNIHTSSTDDEGAEWSSTSAEGESSSNSSSEKGLSGDVGVDAEGWQTFHFDGGLHEYVTWINRGRSYLHEPLYFSKSAVGGVHVEAALQWCSDSFKDNLVGFANSINNQDGGTHLEGLKAAITRTINVIAKRQKLLKEGESSLLGEHVREGLAAVVSVKIPNPEFEGQTKTRLGNPEVKKIVEAAAAESISEWLETHPQALTSILSKAIQASKASEAAKKARELVRRKNVLTRSTLPGKLADCTSSKRAETEIFVVEGDSAGGSAKQARDRKTQAVLPLRGKILNVERSDDASLLKNNEISNLIVALGLGAKAEPLSSSLRYGRVIILTDADVDGAHIRTLLLTFLFRYRRDLFERGHIFVAVPPLYKLELNTLAAALHANVARSVDGALTPQVQQVSLSGTDGPIAQESKDGLKGSGGPISVKGKKKGTKKSSNETQLLEGSLVASEYLLEHTPNGLVDVDVASTSMEQGGTAVATRGKAGSKAVSGPAVVWCYSDDEMRATVKGLPQGSYTMQRFKGLGEMMPEQLWETTLNPETRKLRRLTIDDASAASHIFTLLMGDKVAPRRALIEAEGVKYRFEDLDL